ncbi:hypothetical protein TNCV_2752051 [Trichonephila clavipes]|nr:hypothetical protein TNCV_2752051 [Trichonephila clavipes]
MIETTPCGHFWGMQILLLTGIRGRPNATVMVVNVTMKREKRFICPQDVKNPARIRRRILWTDDGGKPNRLAPSRALLVPDLFGNRFHFDSMVVRLVLDSSTFKFPQNV